MLLIAIAYLTTRPNVILVEQQPVYTLPPSMDLEINEQNKEVRFLRDIAAQEVMSSRKEIQPVYQHGIHGEGQLVGLSDTGLDYNSCFFYDADHSIRFDRNLPDNGHRKVALYEPYTNSQEDDVEAHGTHVAGTLIGETMDPSDHNSKYNGIAYKARLVLEDIGSGTGENAKLETPYRVVKLIESV